MRNTILKSIIAIAFVLIAVAPVNAQSKEKHDYAFVTVNLKGGFNAVLIDSDKSLNQQPLLDKDGNKIKAANNADLIFEIMEDRGYEFYTNTFIVGWTKRQPLPAYVFRKVRK